MLRELGLSRAYVKAFTLDEASFNYNKPNIADINGLGRSLVGIDAEGNKPDLRHKYTGDWLLYKKLNDEVLYLWFGPHPIDECKSSKIRPGQETYQSVARRISDQIRANDF